MKKICYMLPVAGFLMFSSCSSDAPVNTAAQEEAVSPDKVVPNRILSLEIEGMVCKMGCGGSIRKELKATGAVADCEFDFEEDREVNTAKIAFNKEKISADEIVKIISEMNEKQFSVGKTSTSEIDVREVKLEETTSSSASQETAKIKVSETSFKMPDLLKLFSRLIMRN